MADKNRAAVAVVLSDGYSVGIADRGVPGYTPTTYDFHTYDEAKSCAASINELSYALTPQEAGEIVLSTMKGAFA